MLGTRFAKEAVLSGASVTVFDPESAEVENLGTQELAAGRPKVGSLVDDCERIAPGRAQGIVCDVLHVGIGVLATFDLLVDATDDPNLAFPLTEVSNGLGVPLLRLAVDGSGELELGRALTSHGGGGYSCQLCSYSLHDLRRHQPRTPCPGQPQPARASTRAGGALAMVVAGAGLLQAQRLVGGNDLDLVLDRELVIDLSHSQLLSIEKQRVPDCLSGHRSWELTPAGRCAGETTMGDLFALASKLLGSRQVTIEPYAHPFSLGAFCNCGRRQTAVGTVWAAAPECPSCGRAMRWRREGLLERLDGDQAAALDTLDLTLLDLGLPVKGAMVIVRSPDRPPLRLLFSREENSHAR
jgi:hypothetical protein